MLYLIGLGLNENSLTLEAIEILKRCNKVYLENYTSIFKGDLRKIEKLISNKIIKVDRAFVETYKVDEDDVAFLISGDVFSATTHISLFNDAKNVKVLNNASVITAVGITGLELYKFGKTASIPFDNEKIESAFKILEDNKKINAHTLFLLDLDPSKGKFLSIKNGIEYLEKRKFKGKVIGCARLGSDNFVVKYGDIKKIKDYDFGEGPYCLIIPADKLHFMEEEVLRKWEIEE